MFVIHFSFFCCCDFHNFQIFCRSLAGNKIVKVEVECGQKNSLTNSKTHKRGKSSELEYKLDELRKELASLDGGIFPHSILSTQQISMLSAEKPKSMEEVQSLISYHLCLIFMSSRFP